MRIAIIGGDINGLYLSWKLSKKGHQVTLFERKTEIGSDVVCSGLFSKRILDFIPESEKLILNRINSVNIHFPKKSIKVNFSKEFLVIDHGKLNKTVADLALKSGAVINLNQNIIDLPEDYDKIIGCDGTNSIVRKNLNLKPLKSSLGILGFVSNEVRPRCDYVTAWACKTGGFLWEIPRGENLEYGIMTKPEKANQILDKFLEENNISLNKKAKIIPCGISIPKHKKITVCGDAGGITKPWSGGGVIWGLFAADILLETFPDFNTYRKKANRFFIPKIYFSKLILKIIYFIGFNLPWLLPKKAGIESDFLIQ
ncbi:NAD(P)-binding protein [Patescibacteria group bacterium]|nr:NAD(P)-binding protein [Patescibacteria group bacterium]